VNDAVSRLPWWVLTKMVSARMDYTIWPEMCGNGWPIGIIVIITATHLPELLSTFDTHPYPKSFTIIEEATYE